MLQYENPKKQGTSVQNYRYQQSLKCYNLFANSSVSVSASQQSVIISDSIKALAQEIQSGTWGNDWKTAVLSALETAVNASQRTHTVVSGDTLTKIANRYNTTVQAILAANQGTYPDMTADLIRIGWILKV